MSGESIKPGYKQTEVGLIPKEWEAVKVGEVGRFRGGNGFPLRFQGGTANDLPFYKVSDMNNEGNDIFMFDSNNWISEETRKRLGSTIFPADSIIFAKVGAAVFLERKKILSRPSCIDNNLCALVLDKTKTNIRFIHYSMLNFKLGELVSTTALPSLSGAVLSQISIALPPLNEQCAIAAALSDVDALISGFDQLIAKKRDLKHTAMQQLLTGQRRLPGFAGEWEMKTILELADGKKELFDDGDWIESEHITSEGIRLIQTGNIGIGHFIEKDDKKFINEKSFKFLRCKQLKIGDLLVCRLADPAGRATVLPDIGEERIVTSVDVTIFRPRFEIADRVFLANLFSTSKWFRAVSDRSGGTTHKRISRGALGRIEIKLPPLREQSAIASVLADMETELGALEARREKAMALKQGMMQELLTGRIRLV